MVLPPDILVIDIFILRYVQAGKGEEKPPGHTVSKLLIPGWQQF
jgi:hypothetical protein